MQVAPGSTLLYLNSWPLSVATMLHILGLLELLFLSLGQSSLRHSKEYEEVCGWEWQGQYIRLHHAMMSGERRGRYIQSRLAWRTLCTATSRPFHGRSSTIMSILYLRWMS